MEFRTVDEVRRLTDRVSTFGGYNHTVSCGDGQYFEMKNMSNNDFPVLTPRKRRGITKALTAPSGMLDKETVYYVDNGKLYADGVEVPLPGLTLSAEEKTMAKMGAYIIIMPDKVWLNTKDGTCGSMEKSFDYTGTVTMNICSQTGAIITWHDSAYYNTHAPKDGDYMLSTANEKASLKIYSSITSSWNPVATTYFQINAKGIGAGFDKEDGVKITVDATGWDYAQYVFPNDEGNGKRSNNMSIIDKVDDSIVVVGLLDNNKTFSNFHITVERKVPDMAFITECNNRLWGCSKDGHELYCCKLGDVKNWNTFMGLSTDAWAATVGSDGVFTGAITFLGYPIFFKEDSLIKIAVSATGAHQTKETICRGVQRGSHKSIAIINEMLVYKSTTDVCVYTGAMPASISDALGEVRYGSAVGGSIDNRYYISMQDAKGKWHMFCYDRRSNTWCKEDNTHALYFCTHDDDLYFVDADDKKIKSVNGTYMFEDAENKLEKAIDWSAESGMITYEVAEAKYVAKLSIRVTMYNGATMDIYLVHDDGELEHKVSIYGNGTRSVTVPFTPKRCDHFKYILIGKGDCKIHSITKSYEGGSDVTYGGGYPTIS